MGSIIIAYIITIVIAWYLGRKYIDFSLITKLKTKKLLHFSKWLAGINLFGNLYGKLDVMMLAWLSSAYATGIYAAAARFILIFPLVVASLSSVVAPRFANRTNVQSLHQYFKKTILISCGLTAIMSTLILLAKTLIILAYEEAFLDAIPVFQLLVVAFLPLILSIPATNAIIYFFKKPKIITFIATAQLTGLVLLNLTVIPRYGVFGPVYSLIAMNLFGMICQYVSYFYLYKKSK
jgi:O-antigen/teichoic acid export membrane protein